MKKLFYLCLLVLTFSCDSDDGIQPLTPLKLLVNGPLNAIDISRITINGIDMTDDPLFSEMDVEEIDGSFDDLEESTFNFMDDNTVTITGSEGDLVTLSINGSKLTIDELTFDVISLNSNKMVLEMDFLSMMDDAFDAMDDDSDDIFGNLVDMDIITEWHFSKTKRNK